MKRKSKAITCIAKGPPALTNIELRASKIYAEILRQFPGNTLWHRQLREQAENPARYHPVTEVKNTKRICIGDFVRFARRGKFESWIGIVTSTEKKTAQLQGIQPGCYGGWFALGLLAKIPPIAVLNAPKPIVLPKRTAKTVWENL